MLDVDFRATGHRFEGDRGAHFAGQVGVFEYVGVHDPLIGHQLQVNAPEGVALPVAQVGEMHAVAPADSGVELKHLAGEAMGRHPLRDGLRIKKGAVQALGWGSENAVQCDGGHGKFS